MTSEGLLPVDRFIATLDIVQKEGVHLSFSWLRLFSNNVDSPWVQELNQNPEVAEQLEAFVSRFGRMQDTIADKLLPRWLQAQAENTGSQIEVLNRAERLGVIENVDHWLEARKLRNRLVHNYMVSTEDFAGDLGLAKGYSLMLIDTYNRVRGFAVDRMGIDVGVLPGCLDELPSVSGSNIFSNKV